MTTGSFNFGVSPFYMTTGSSIMGEANRDFSGYNEMIVLGTYGTGQSWDDLHIDTAATNNGGKFNNLTKTVYVFEDSLALNKADVAKIR